MSKTKILEFIKVNVKNAKLRIIVFGAGFWGQRWIKAIQNDLRCDLVAVVTKPDDTPQEVLQYLQAHSINCISDYSDVFGKVRADAAVVVVPPKLHFEVLSACLEEGLHILCEKPLTATWDEAVRIADMAKRKSARKFMVSQTRRWCDHIQTLKSVIDSGRIGKISFVTVDHRVHNRHGGWREELDYPVLEDMGVHHFDAMRFYTGAEPVSVYARSWNPDWSWYKGQACSSAIFEMTNGIYINYLGSWCTQGQQTTWEGRIQVVGEKGSLELVDEETLFFYPAETGREPGTCPQPQVVPITPIEKREIDYSLNEFCDAILQDRKPETDVFDNLGTMAMSCAAVESCRKGTLIKMTKKYKY